jgi:nucleoside-diphosphate-sugar epimerase
MQSSRFRGPVNIGSEEMVTINHMASMIMAIAGKRVAIRHVPGPQGVRGRNSDNTLIHRQLGWAPSACLEDGLTKTYRWIDAQVNTRRETGELVACAAAAAGAAR